MARFVCASCGYAKSVPDSLVGARVKCPACQTVGGVASDLRSDTWELLERESLAPEAGESASPQHTQESHDAPDQEFFDDFLSRLELKPEPDGQASNPEEAFLRAMGQPPAPTKFKPPALPLTERERAGIGPRFGLLHGKPLANALAGVTVGIESLIVYLSVAALLFSGILPDDYFLQGLGIVLVSAVFFGLAMAADTSLPAIVAGPEGASAVAVWTLALSISRQMQGAYSSSQIFQTIMAGILLAGLFLGLVFYATGKLKGATWLRFLPYQVLAGLVIGAAFLLLKGAYVLSMDSPLCLQALPDLFWSRGCAAWLPVLVLGLAFHLLLWKRDNPLPFIFLVLAGIGLSLWLVPRYIAPYFATPPESWFLPAKPGFRFWEVYSRDMFSQVQWPVLAAQAGHFLALIAFVCGSALVKLSQLELSQGKGADMNREYATLGLGSILSAAAAGMPGSVSQNRSMSLAGLGGRGSLASLAMVATLGAGLYFAPRFIGLIPRWMPPVLLTYFAFRLIKRTMYDFRGAYWQGNSLVVFSVAAALLVLGLPLGMALSLFLALVILLIRNGRVSPIRHALSGAQFHSKVDRPADHMRFLHQEGDVIFILRLQGYLSLGSFQTIAAELRLRRSRVDLPPLKYLILDFTRVRGLDSSAGLGLASLKSMAREYGCELVITNLPLEEEDLLERGGLILNDPEAGCRTYLDIDYALEWSESRLLEAWGHKPQEPLSLDTYLDQAFGLPRAARRLQGYAETIHMPAGSVILQQGEQTNALYFVEQGIVTIRLHLQDGSVFRLRKMGPGSVFGEMGMYDDDPRSATAMADEDCRLLRLTEANMKQLRRKDPELMRAIDHFIIKHLAARVRETNLILREAVD